MIQVLSNLTHGLRVIINYPLNCNIIQFSEWLEGILKAKIY